MTHAPYSGNLYKRGLGTLSTQRAFIVLPLGNYALTKFRIAFAPAALLASPYWHKFIKWRVLRLAFTP